MLLSIDARLHYRFANPCEVLLLLEAARTPEQRVIRDDLRLSVGEAVRCADAATGERHALFDAQGDVEIHYASEVEIARPDPAIAGATACRVRDLPAEALPYLRPSRYCPSDRFDGLVRRRFGGLEGGAKVVAILDFVHDHLAYEVGASDPFTTACETFAGGTGVCRDFTHLAISLCRAADIPARAVSAYAWRLDPPDLHAVLEVFLEGRWRLADPTGKAPVEGLIRIATGRDAADIAFMNIFGRAEMVSQSFAVRQATASAANTDGPGRNAAVMA